VTVTFSANQALLAAKAGATYVSPFVGRLDDISEEGMELIGHIRRIYDNYEFETKILVASVRNPIHVRDAALIGADVATIPAAVLKQLASHPLTDIGIEKFLKDWEKIPK
jgi:transaldolase